MIIIKCDNTPSRPTPDNVKVVKLNFSWPVIRLVVFSHFRLGILHISLRPHKIQPRRWKKKNKRTNTDLGQLQAQEREFVTLCNLRALVDYRRRVLCAKLLQKPLGMLTHLWLSSLTASFSWPSFPWTAISSRLSSSVFSCRQTLCIFSGTFLPSSTSGLVGGLAVRPFMWVCVAPKQTKRFSDRRAHTHTHTHPTQRMAT